MRVQLDNNYEYKGITFCCTVMGDAIMQGTIKAQPHTDHFPRFKLERHLIDYYPYCGARIAGTIEPR